MGRVIGQKVHVHKTTTSKHGRHMPIVTSRRQEGGMTGLSRIKTTGVQRWPIHIDAVARSNVQQPLMASESPSEAMTTHLNIKHKKTQNSKVLSHQHIVQLMVILRSGSRLEATTSVAALAHRLAPVPHRKKFELALHICIYRHVTLHHVEPVPNS